MARLTQIVVNCDAPPALARFWAEVLDDFEIRPYDKAEIERLGASGLSPESDPIVMLDGPGLEICFQQLETAPSAQQRLHLDLTAGDRVAEVRRLTRLGAQVRQEFERHSWMVDPEGNDFCVTEQR